MTIYKGFISYSHADRDICLALQKALAPLRDQIRFWCDRDLEAGEAWRPQIAFHLKRSQVAIILSSPDAFRHDNFLMTKELPNAEMLWRAGRLVVITATARPVSLGGLFLSQTELCPEKGRTLSSGYDQLALDAWCAEVAAAVADRLRVGVGLPVAPHNQIVRMALEGLREQTQALEMMLVDADAEVSDEASFELVAVCQGVSGALRSPVADLRADIDAVTTAFERVADANSVGGACHTAMLMLMVGLNKLNDLLANENYPLPPGHMPARVRPLRNRTESEPVQLGERMDAVGEELPYVRQHGGSARDAAEHIEAKLQVGRALMAGQKVDAMGVRKVLTDIQEEASALSDACLEPEGSAALADNALRLRAAATPAARPLKPGTVFQDASFAPRLVVVPPGEFLMGASAGDREAYPDERPQHLVRIRRAFAIGVYPVTVSQWRMFEAATGRQQEAGEGQAADEAVGGVTWVQARAYCEWLGRVCGAAYRLPSEAEWEYACRAGTQTAFWFGERMEASDGASSENWPRMGVGSFAANPFGLFDVHGTVWEWCEDRWRQNYRGAPLDGSAWLEGRSPKRVARGGSWESASRHARASNRYGEEPEVAAPDMGLRVVRAL